MPEETSTTWTCSRCGDTLVVPDRGQPKDWVTVSFASPPRGADLHQVGHLCNKPTCGGTLVDFVHGKDPEFADLQARVDRVVRLVDMFPIWFRTKDVRRLQAAASNHESHAVIEVTVRLDRMDDYYTVAGYIEQGVR